MLLLRAYDERMHRAQRQGKTSFYMQSLGEEAISVAQAMALAPDDMCFPSYRQQGILIARGYPLVDMMHQIYSNARDPMKGRQLPVMYSSKKDGFFTISATSPPSPASCRLGDGVGVRKRWPHRVDLARRGSTAEGDFHAAMTFANVYRAPVIINVVNNQWAISSFKASPAVRTPPSPPALLGTASRRCASTATTSSPFTPPQWAAERARANLGPSDD